ncbi:hypothetical protein Ciccas_012703, partial [Cichlidogyrus casuarinus]
MEEQDELFRSEPVEGECLVMCYHPCSKLKLQLMEEEQVVEVIQKWTEISSKYYATSVYKWVQIFENHGEMVGCSNPHPHCQIWASKFLPTLPERMDKNLLKYFEKHQKPLLVDYCEKEKFSLSHRFVCENNDWVVYVPWWAQWPFETILLPKNPNLRTLSELSAEETRSLANILKSLLIKYDNLFATDFPYCFAWYQAPLNHNSVLHWTLHGVFFPPLLRSAHVKKFVAGYELFSECQ